MPPFATSTNPTESATRKAGAVLVVDDSRAQRHVLALTLRRAGYDVSEAASGEEAMELCLRQSFDIVLSDWMMPGMSGLELCRAFKDLPRAGYGYFILLTSKSEKAEVANGLDCGADDFLAKPVNPDELRARLRAGERILSMQAELLDRNRLVASTLGELQKLYDSLDRDLIEARKLQQTLVRERYRDFSRGEVSLLLRPSGHIGGDLVGFFEIDADHLGVYSVDVSGHGVASAMMTARLAGLLSGNSPEHNLALTRDASGRQHGLAPAEVAARFNNVMLHDMQVEQYFTIVYAEIDLRSGAVRLVQAGHPHPLVLRGAGGVEYLGDGGLPVGLIEGATYAQTDLTLHPGDRLLLVSDGMTECPDPNGQELGEAGLARIILANAGLPVREVLEAIVWNLAGHAGSDDFPDDVSGALFHYRG